MCLSLHPPSPSLVLSISLSRSRALTRSRSRSRPVKVLVKLLVIARLPVDEVVEEEPRHKQRLIARAGVGWELEDEIVRGTARHAQPTHVAAGPHVLQLAHQLLDLALGGRGRGAADVGAVDAVEARGSQAVDAAAGAGAGAVELVEGVVGGVAHRHMLVARPYPNSQKSVP